MMTVQERNRNWRLMHQSREWWDNNRQRLLQELRQLSQDLKFDIIGILPKELKEELFEGEITC